MGEVQYAVIGRSETYPTLYHMNQTRPNAERLCQRRETASRCPCFVITMGAWAANPLAALEEAEAGRLLTAESAGRAGHDRYLATGRRS